MPDARSLLRLTFDALAMRQESIERYDVYAKSERDWAYMPHGLRGSSIWNDALAMNTPRGSYTELASRVATRRPSFLSASARSRLCIFATLLPRNTGHHGLIDFVRPRRRVETLPTPAWVLSRHYSYRYTADATRRLINVTPGWRSRCKSAHQRHEPTSVRLSRAGRWRDVSADAFAALCRRYAYRPFATMRASLIASILTKYLYYFRLLRAWLIWLHKLTFGLRMTRMPRHAIRQLCFILLSPRLIAISFDEFDLLTPCSAVLILRYEREH